jgi:hypothetical protein
MCYYRTCFYQSWRHISTYVCEKHITINSHCHSSYISKETAIVHSDTGTSELNGRAELKKMKLTDYMKASSSSSVDAALLPFDDAALFPFDDAVLLPFDDAVLLALVLGMKISSSSSLSWVHK